MAKLPHDFPRKPEETLNPRDIIKLLPRKPKELPKAIVYFWNRPVPLNARVVLPPRWGMPVYGLEAKREARRLYWAMRKAGNRGRKMRDQLYAVIHGEKPLEHWRWKECLAMIHAASVPVPPKRAVAPPTPVTTTRKMSVSLLSGGRPSIVLR